MNDVVLVSVLICPNCGFAAQETMPTEACLYFYELAKDPRHTFPYQFRIHI